MASPPKPSQEAPTRVERPSEPAAAEAPSTPSTRDPRYAPGDEIARGGMGRVVEATDTMLGRTVAIKEALALDPEALRRFARETRITARLEHPAIIPVYDAGRTANGTPYYVMRKVGGRGLDKVVQEAASVATRLALVPHVLAAVDAIAHAHGRGVIHRDIKPSNILVGELGETIVIDWGLAKVFAEPDDDDDDDLTITSSGGTRIATTPPERGDALQAVLPAGGRPGRRVPAVPSLGDSLRTRVGAVIGTPGFMSPRQLAGSRATPACDVYALGATLYYVLAARPPHASRDPDTTVALALAGPPEPVAQLAPGVPPELAAIVARAMHYDTRERYPDAAALGVDLRNFLSGQLVAAHHYSTRERITRFASKHRAAITVSLIAIAAIVVIARLAIVSILRERDAATAAQEQASLEKRAAVEARRREAERADELLVAQAAALVATNPLAAVGLLHQLPAGSAQWLTARDVLVEARSRGVPWALPASHETVGLALSPDGGVAYSGGDDGIVRRHDLATGTATQLAKLGAAARLVFVPGRDPADGDALALATNTAELTWYDLRSGRSTVVPLTAPIARLAGGPGLVVWCEAGGALWLLARGDAAPRRLPGESRKLLELEVSPTGKHLAIGGDPDTLVVELGAAPRVVLTRAVRTNELAWSSDGSRLAIASYAGIDELDVGVEPPRLETLGTGFTPVAAYDGDDLYFGSGDGRIYQRIRNRIVDTGVPSDAYATSVAVRDAVAFVTTAGVITVLGRGGRASLRAPAATLLRSAGRAARLVVGTTDYLLSYDLSPVLPRTFAATTGNTTFHGFFGDEYLQAYMLDPWKLIDPAKGSARTVPNVPLATIISIAPDGSYLLAHENKSSALELIRRDGTRRRLHPKARGLARSATKVVLLVEREVRELDLATGEQRILHTADDHIAAMRSDGAYLVAATPTQLWRHDTTTDTSATLPLVRASIVGLEVAATGEAFVATPRRIVRWNRDGTSGDLAVPDRTLRGLVNSHGAGLVAGDDAHVQWLVGGAVPRRAFPDGFQVTHIAKRAPIAVGLTPDRQVAAYDLLGERFWVLGAGEVVADLTEDGRYVATYATDRVAIFTLDLPDDRAAFDKLLAATTNLRTRGTANELVWPR